MKIWFKNLKYQLRDYYLGGFELARLYWLPHILGQNEFDWEFWHWLSGEGIRYKHPQLPDQVPWKEWEIFSYCRPKAKRTITNFLAWKQEKQEKLEYLKQRSLCCNQLKK